MSRSTSYLKIVSMIRPCRQCFILQNPRGHPVQMRPRHRMKIRIPRSIRSLLRQRYAEDTVIPLEVQTCHVKLPRQVFQVKIIVIDSPRVILAKAVNDQTVTP